jgi:hypothetical protein
MVYLDMSEFQPRGADIPQSHEGSMRNGQKVFGIEPRGGPVGAEWGPDAMPDPLSPFFVFALVAKAFAFMVKKDDFPEHKAVALRTVTLSVKEKTATIATPQR